VTASRTVIVAGAGIGGLTAALALAARQFRVVVLEQAPRLQEAGAGLQLSPNAMRILVQLGLAEALRGKALAPEAICLRVARSGRVLARIPLGSAIEQRYGAPYCVAHRADLQAALLAAARDHPDIEIQLNRRVEDFAVHAHGVTVQTRTGPTVSDERGAALIAADGVWSALRALLGDKRPPEFADRSAWRATIPAADAPPDLRKPVINLWLGHNAHLVHYPLRGGTLINIVAIMRERWHSQDWNALGEREDILARFRPWHWASAARTLMAVPQQWLKWALHECPGWRRAEGPVTLLGDAAHAMLPFLAQGAAMAIEDAATLAEAMASRRDKPAEAFRIYEAIRRPRATRVQREARQAGRIYHLYGPTALARNLSLWAMGGEILRGRYDWLYDWRVPDIS
jgi:salicylate hydroxylase